MGLIPLITSKENLIAFFFFLILKSVDKILPLRADFLHEISDAKAPKPYVPTDTSAYQATYGSKVDFI